MHAVTVKIVFICSFLSGLGESSPKFQHVTIQTPQKVAVAGTGLKHVNSTLPTSSIRKRNDIPLSGGTVLNNFVHQLFKPNNQSHTSSTLNETSTLPMQNDPQAFISGLSTAGLSNFLFILGNLTNRPLSDQSALSSSGGIVSGSVGVVQEAFNQVSSNLQQGFGSIIGSNQANQASTGNWAPIRPHGSASPSSKPAFCPNNCTMVCGIPQKNASNERIIGGVDVSPSNKYPWIALIQYYDRNTGSGTLINDRVVLTSASIISTMVVFKQIKVILGALDASSSAETTRMEYTVTKTRVHPQYSTEQPVHHNIGFLQLAVPVTITSTLMPICIPTSGDTFADTNGTLAGWGAHALGVEPWKTLQEVNIPLYSYDECRLAFPNLTENNICGGVFDPAPKNQHATSCDADEGASLMYPWKSNSSILTLIGISLQLADAGCGKTDKPALFTKVYGYIPWVKSQVSGCYCMS